MSAVTSFEENVKERLKGIVADLIPEDRYNALVAAAVADFEKNDLPRLVKESLSAKYREVIAAEFAKPEWQMKWAGAEHAASDAVRQLLVDNAALILANMIGGAMQQTVQTMHYTVQQHRGY